MKFRSVPPDPAEFPRARFIWPIAIPVGLALLVLVTERAGYQWNIHGGGAFVLLAFFITVAVGAVASVISLASAIPALRQHPTLRTRANMACVVASTVFVAFALGSIGVSLFKLALP